MPKRAAVAENKAAPVRKAPKTNPKFAPVIEAIAKAVELGRLEQAATAMLVAMVPGALGEVPARRHAVQVTVVGMLEEVMEGVRTHFQEEVDAAGTKVRELESSKDTRASKAQEAQQLLATAQEERSSKKAALADVMKRLAQAKDATKSAAKARKEGDSTLAEATQQQESFNQTIESHFKVLLSGEFGEESPEHHKAAVLQLIEKVGVEESCRLSFGPVCVKPSADRSAFDTLVLQTVAEAFETKAKEFAGKVDELAASAKSSTAASEEADQAVEDLQAEKQLAETAVSESVAREAEAKETFGQAEKSRDEFDTVYGQAVSEQEACATTLESFVSHNLACLERLRDGEVRKEIMEAPKEPVEAPMEVAETQDVSVEAPVESAPAPAELPEAPKVISEVHMEGAESAAIAGA